MKTIVTCALLAVLAFGLLPEMEQQRIPEDDGLVLLTQRRPWTTGRSGFSRGRRFWSFPWRTT